MGYYSGQGKVLVAERDANGNAKAFRFLGNCSAVNLALQTDVLEHKESTSGQRLTDLRLIREKKAQLSIQMEEFSQKNLALAMYGTDSAIAAGSVVSETFPTSLIVGDLVRTAKPDISAPVVTDSTGSPLTLTLNTDYRVFSAKHGTIEILNLGAYIQPFKINYSNAAAVNINMLTGSLPERWFRFEGLNTADSDKPVLIEVYRVALDPLKEAAFLGDDILKMELAGSGLYDSTKSADTVLGQFARVVLVD